MSLNAQETSEILSAAPTFEKGKEMVKMISGVAEMYSYEGTDYTKVDDKVLKMDY